MGDAVDSKGEDIRNEKILRIMRKQYILLIPERLENSKGQVETVYSHHEVIHVPLPRHIAS
jgi:hypothetical protein